MSDSPLERSGNDNASEAHLLYCFACGRPLPSGARFCPACGQLIATTNRPTEQGDEEASSVSTEEGIISGERPSPGELSSPSPGVSDAASDGVPEVPRALLPGQAALVSTPTEVATGTRRNRTTLLLGLLSGLLLLALVTGGALAYVELDRRIAREQALAGQVASLTQANLDFQSQVQSLTGERDRLTSERDALAAERDRLVARVGELEAKNAEQEKQIRELTGQVQEQSRQLSESRAEASRQQQRAETAEQFSFVLAQVVAIDDEIHEEFQRFYTAVLEMQDAYYLGNRLAFESAARRAEESAQKLDQLFARRAQLLDQLRQ